MKRSDAEGKQLDKAVRLIEGGKKDEALAVIKDVLIDNQDNETAWRLLARITDEPKEREYAVFQLRRLGVDQVPEMAGSIDGGNVEARVKQAYDQVKTGNQRTARNMIRPVLQKYPGHAGAWFVKGIAAKDRSDYLEALRTLESLASTDPEAKQYFDRLKTYKGQEKKRRKIAPIWFMIGGFVLLFLLIGVGLFLPLIFPTPEVTSEAGSATEAKVGDVFDNTATLPSSLTCEQLIRNAMLVSDQGCQQIGSNQVCYGNDQLVSDILGNPDEFNLVGDVLDVDKLVSLKASPLDIAKNLWGVAVFKLRAKDLQGFVTGQNVTFLVFGNTNIENASGDMSAFYFSTGFGGIRCQGVDFDGLQVQLPDGAEIEFMANGVELALKGHAILTANAGGEMNVTLVTGSGTVSANGVTQSMSPGTYVSVPVDDNLEASGAPSDPQELTAEQASLLCQLYGINCPPGTTSIILGNSTPIPAIATMYAQSTMTALAQLTGTIETPTPAAIFTSSRTPTPTRTRTPSPTQTNTPITPTTQAAPVSCSSISLSGGGGGVFTITNNNSSPIVLTNMALTWPEENGSWQMVKLGSATIANPQADPPSASVVFSASLDKRTIMAGSSLALSNTFENKTPAASGYSVTVSFDVGCPKSRSN